MSVQRHPDLHDARESLEYWERRARTLPKRDRKGRKEAQTQIEKCRRRVADAERERYGEGMVGALTQVASEGRLPEPLRQTGRSVARHGRNAVVAVVALTVAVSVLVLAAAIAILVAIL